MRTAAHRLLVAILLALIGFGYLAGGTGTQAQDGAVGDAGDGSLQLGLPFAVRETWRFEGTWATPIPTTGATTGALDFTFQGPANSGAVTGRGVVAMRGGTVSLPCANMVKINHGTFSTVYYPVGNVAVAAGATVTRGQSLGVTTAIPGGCAGAEDDQHANVRVWIEQGGNVVDPVGKDVGGWTVQGGGYLQRGDVVTYDIPNDGEVGSTVAPFAKVQSDVSGRVGQAIPYSLSGFPVSTAVTLEWRRSDGSIVPLGTSRTSPGGTAEGYVTIPEAPAGLYGAYIHAVVARTATVMRWVPARVGPDMTTNTLTVARGETVTLVVRGFLPNVSLPINVQYTGQGYQALTQRLTTDQFGKGTAAVMISPSAPLGGGAFRVQDQTNNTAVGAGFTVTGVPTLDFSFDPAIVNESRYPLPGESFVAYLRKFPASADVSLSMTLLDEYGDPTSTVYQLGSGRTDAAGGASIQARIPANTDAAAYAFTASGGGRSVSVRRFTGRLFSISPMSAPPGGPLTLDVTGYPPGSSITLEWWDGEVWQPLEEATVPANRLIPLVVPAEAAPGLTIRIAQLSYVNGNPYRPVWAELLVTDPGSNTPPTANAGADRTVSSPTGSGVAVSLSGSSSSDPGGSIASYTWRENGTQIATGVSPSVTLTPGVHTIQLTVVDTGGLAGIDTVVITVGRAPVANAGPDQTVADPESNGQAVTLNGAGSSDPDGSVSTFVWKEGATQLVAGAQPTVTLAAGTHTITLTVTDDDGLTATDRVVITVTVPRPPMTLTLDKVSSKFNGLVTATLTGFTPNSAVTLKWPRDFAVTATGPPTTDLLASGTTDAQGRATLTFPTPLEPFLATGYVVTARDAGGEAATATLRVIPRVTLAPTAEGPTTTRLRVYFYGFAPNEQIEVRWHSGPTNASGYVVIKTLTVAATGRASSIVVIPSSSAVGRHLVVGKVVGVSRSASTPFDVTAGGGSVDEPDATPKATRTATPEATATPAPSATATAEATSEATETPAPTETATPEPTATATPEPTETPAPTATATPVPNASPMAAAGDDQTVTDADGTGDEPVTLDGRGSSDPEGAELTYSWAVDGVEVATGPTPSVTLPVGVTTVVLTVTDAAGATATDEVAITVESAGPPATDPGEGTGEDGAGGQAGS